MTSRVCLLMAAVLVSAPAVARADDDPFETEAPLPGIPDGWHADVMPIADLPLAATDFRAVTSFGGGIELRAYLRSLELELENVVFSQQDTTKAERLSYRTRLLAGLRHARVLEGSRAIIVRATAGVELGGFDPIGSSDFVASSHRLGFAAEVGVESRSQLDWGVITLSLGLAASLSPFGKTDQDHVSYVGLELIAGLGVGF